MHEHILAAVFRLNKAKSFCGVEPFHGASSHFDPAFLVKSRPRIAAVWCSQVGITLRLPYDMGGRQEIVVVTDGRVELNRLKIK